MTSPAELLCVPFCNMHRNFREKKPVPNCRALLCRRAGSQSVLPFARGWRLRRGKAAQPRGKEKPSLRAPSPRTLYPTYPCALTSPLLRISPLSQVSLSSRLRPPSPPRFYPHQGRPSPAAGRQPVRLRGVRRLLARPGDPPVGTLHHRRPDGVYIELVDD